MNNLTSNTSIVKKRPTIGLISVMKDEENNIGRMLSSTIPFVDKAVIIDTGSKDKSVQIAKNFGAEVIEMGEKFVKPLYENGIPIFHFDEAKNFALDNIDTDYFLWLDSDDELIGGQNIPRVLEFLERNNFSATYFRYIYFADFDERGQIKNINIEHLRERIVKNDKTYKWVGKLHETLIEQRPTAKSDNYDMLVIHHTDWVEMEKALYRNVVTLQEIVISENGKDPRNIYYLAKTYFDLHDPILYEYTISLLQQYLDMSGWAEERAQAWTYLSFIHIEKGEIDQAIRAALMSFYEDPKFPDSYIVLALSYLSKKDWQKALHWARLASQVEVPKTTLVVTPKDLQIRTLDVIFHACLNTGRIKEAQQAAEKLLQILPSDNALTERKSFIDSIVDDNDTAQAILKLANYHIVRNNRRKLFATVDSIPDNLAFEPAMVQLRNAVLPPKKWESNEIVIYCGPGFEKWSPKNLDQGIGGSESAVIYLSRELVKLGWRVTVLGDPQEPEILDRGVIYKPFYFFNPADEFNIFIAWRNPALYDFKPKAKLKMVWCHDIQNPNDYSPDRLDQIDKVIVLSQWQRDNIPTVPDEKIYISRNGIPLEKLSPKIKRIPTKVFYASSYDRGLERLLNMWPEVKRQVPQAELKILYGWNLFDAIVGNNPERMSWKDKINKLMEQDGIEHLGRVSQEEQIKIIQSCGIWAYPTHFGEISCQTAMLAQSYGAIPVVVDYAALKETVQYGEKVDGDIYDKETQEVFLKSLVGLLNDIKKQEEIRGGMVAWAREHFSWNEVAKNWTENLLKPKLILPKEVENGGIQVLQG